MSSAPGWWRILRLPLAVIGTGYVCLAVCAPFLAGRLLYHPEFGSMGAPAGLMKIRTEDGGELAVWHLPRPGARFTIWFFHGNAEDLGDIAPFLRALHAAGFAVFSFDYPGYGHSSGQPTEASLYRSARAARAYLRDVLNVPAAQTLLLGRSLGGGPAVQMAVEENVAGLVLQSTFTSAYRVITRWRLLPSDQFENLAKLPRVSSPVLVIHGRADEVIPFHHGETLLASVPGPRRHLWVPAGGHNNLLDVAGTRYWEALQGFSELCAARVGPPP